MELEIVQLFVLTAYIPHSLRARLSDLAHVSEGETFGQKPPLCHKPEPLPAPDRRTYSPKD